MRKIAPFIFLTFFVSLSLAAPKERDKQSKNKQNTNNAAAAASSSNNQANDDDNNSEPNVVDGIRTQLLRMADGAEQRAEQVEQRPSLPGNANTEDWPVVAVNLRDVATRMRDLAAEENLSPRAALELLQESFRVLDSIDRAEIESEVARIEPEAVARNDAAVMADIVAAREAAQRRAPVQDVFEIMIEEARALENGENATEARERSRARIDVLMHNRDQNHDQSGKGGFSGSASQ